MPDEQAASISAFQRAGVLLKRDASGGGSFAVALWGRLAEQALAAGDITEAGKALEAGLRIFPDAPDLNYITGELWLKVGDLSSAIGAFSKCLSPACRAFSMRLRAGVCDHLPQAQLGMLCIKTGDMTGALAFLKRAVRNAPEGAPRPRLYLGWRTC